MKQIKIEAFSTASHTLVMYIDLGSKRLHRARERMTKYNQVKAKTLAQNMN